MFVGEVAHPGAHGQVADLELVQTGGRQVVDVVGEDGAAGGFVGFGNEVIGVGVEEPFAAEPHAAAGALDGAHDGVLRFESAERCP